MQQELTLHFTPRNKMVNDSKRTFKSFKKSGKRPEIENRTVVDRGQWMDEMKIQEKSRSKILNERKYDTYQDCQRCV